MDRIILHSDLNSFYASVECLYHPELRERPVAVCGDPEARHGIILTANRIAKNAGVKTGEAIWEAKQKCLSLVTLAPDYSKYLRFSRMAREIYLDYTDRVEPFGIDEAWLDLTGSVSLFGEGRQVAERIRERIREELGITVSIGVSFNKIFAKLGSDYKKPDAVTVISKENYRPLVWPLPAKDLLYVGRATARKLFDHGIATIGGVAQTEPLLLERWLGKWGRMLWRFANGLDDSPVCVYGDEAVIQSVGNSATTPRDLEDDGDVRLMLTVLADSVAERTRELGFLGQTVSLSVRDAGLACFTRQRKLERPTCLTGEIAGAAFSLFQEHYRWERPIRSIGLSLSGLSCGDVPVQFDLFCDQARREKRARLESAVDGLRGRFGHACVRRAVVMADRDFAGMNPKGEHIIHPVGYLKGGEGA